jgi:hypothetical protein
LHFRVGRFSVGRSIVLGSFDVQVRTSIPAGIHVEAVDSLCDSAASRFVMKATVYPTKGSSGFVGYGDADPSNVSLRVRGAEMRMAETRAVNRALRKAYGIGSGVRFPQNPCTTCPFLGLCLDQHELVETALIRKPGVDLGLFDELTY